MSKVDVNKLAELVEQGYLTMRSHPTADLVIWNYTPRTQYDQYWTPETMMCRGLITTPDGTVIARPFPKFHNIEQYNGPLPLEPFEVTEKLDGSLGILYFVDHTPYLATRGSFTSEQAIRGTKILHEKYSHSEFMPTYTYLFEIVYPENRIVVNYGTREDIVLLSVIDTETGKEYSLYTDSLHATWPFPVAKRYDGIHDLSQIKALEEANKEGFVIRFESGLRVKAKFSEYVRLHRILTQCTARTIWEYLKENKSLDEVLDRVPDEFYTWVKRTRDELLAQFTAIETECKQVVERVQAITTRKEQAAIIVKERYPGIVFSMLDHKRYQDAIWKLLYPEASRPFALDEEA